MPCGASFNEAFEKLKCGRPLILGHRGAPRSAPENTLASFERAFAAGADGIELDVNITADGILVAHHDEETHAGVRLDQMEFDALRQARYELTALADVFRAVAGRGLLNIELKQSGYEDAVIELALSMLPPHTFAFSSFLPEAVAACRRLAVDVPAFWIVYGERKPEEDLAALERIDASGIAFETSTTTEELVRYFRSRQYPVFIWVVNDPQQARIFSTWGVTGLISDDPEALILDFQRNPLPHD